MRIQQTSYTPFEAMKPNQFKGFDYACVRKFKAPVEKFETEKNFYGWAMDKLNVFVKEKLVEGKSDLTVTRRKEGIFEWRTELGFDLEAAPLALIVLTSILKDLKPNNDKLPPILSKDIFRKTVEDLEKQLADNKDLQFNFKDIYNKNLKINLTNEHNPDFNGWIKIPSQHNDPQNFKKNVDKLKVLSNKTWCTKNYHAEVMLKFGDFHVYLEKGEPKIGLRFSDGLLTEIQSERNDGFLDAKYFDIVDSFIRQKGVAMEEKALYTYYNSKNTADKIKALQNKVSEALAENNHFKILQALDFKPEILDDGTFSINEYKQFEINLKEIGINEETLLDNVSEIRGDADFCDSDIKYLKSLKLIHGSADFCNSRITDTGPLEIIKGDANFAFSDIETFGKLKHIGGSCNITHSPIKNLEPLEFVGRNLSVKKDVSIPDKLIVEGTTFFI